MLAWDRGVWMVEACVYSCFRSSKGRKFHGRGFFVKLLVGLEKKFLFDVSTAKIGVLEFA